MKREVIYRWFAAVTMVAGLLLWSLAASAQERIDEWYGKEMTLLHAQLQYEHDMYKNAFKYKVYDENKVSLTMTDYRGVKCEYVSLNSGYTIKYRIDHYSKSQYDRRVLQINTKWTKRGSYYVLRNTVFAVLNDKERSILFAPAINAEQMGIDAYNSTERNVEILWMTSKR